MAYFLEEIFKKQNLALVDFSYTSKYRDINIPTENIPELSHQKNDDSLVKGEDILNVYEKDVIYINREVLCNPACLRYIWKVRKWLRIQPLKAFYIGDGKYNKDKFNKWKISLTPDEKYRLTQWIARFQKYFGIPPFWMNFFENFLTKGIYRYPDFIDKEKLQNRELKNNYQNLGVPGMGYLNQEYETNFYKPPISNSSAINRSRYSIFNNGDGSYVMTVFSGVSRKKDFENAYAEIEEMGLERVPPKKSENGLEILAVFLHKTFASNTDLTQPFLSQYQKVFSKTANQMDKNVGELNRIKKDLSKFKKEHKEWIKKYT